MATKRIVATRRQRSKTGDSDEAVPGSRRGMAGARKRISDAMPEIADVLVKNAKQGSVPHLKMALQISGVDKRSAKAVAKPAYAQRVERELLKELQELSGGSGEL
jgi:hypothetical protein